MGKIKRVLVFLFAAVFLTTLVLASDKEESRKKELEDLQKKFEWWPTDAKPGPVKDPDKGGYWWWPDKPEKEGSSSLWGNRGWVYVYKIIYDYKAEELPPPKPQEPRPSLLIRKIIRNVKIYFDFDKSDLREDAAKMLKKAVETLKRNPESSILITGNCDARGSESYNVKLGRRRGEVVKDFMLQSGIPDERIRIISRGKLDAIAPVTDIMAMQKDRNAQFMIAEVEEVMIPAPECPAEIQAGATPIEEGKYLIEEKENVESAMKVSTREYVVEKGDTLSKIAQNEYGGAHRWKYLYELNKSRIKNPNKLEVGQRIIIPVE